MSSNDKKPVVYIVHHHIPHYREAIFDRLMGDGEIQYVLLADRKTYTENMAILTPEKKPYWKWRVVGLKTKRFFGMKFAWQWKAITSCLFDNMDGIIFLGDRQFISTWIAALICRIRGVTAFEWGMVLRRPEVGLKWFGRKVFLRLFKGHLVYGQWAKHWLIQHGFNTNRVWVVYNSIDYENNSRIRQGLSRNSISNVKRKICGGDNIPLLFHSGRLTVRKKLPLLFEAMAMLRKNGKVVHLIIVGDGPIKSELESEVRKHALSGQVHFWGACYDEVTLGLLMSASDIAVAPGAIGLFAIHAFSYGLPVITHDNQSWTHGPEYEAIIPGKTGMLFRENDAKDLLNRIDQVLYGGISKENMARECLSVVRNLYNPVYQQIVFRNALNDLGI